jgi:hypothetical protein
MDIDELIRDLILEENFKTKYTKRQQTVFCNNMYGKISAFISKYEEKLKESEKKVDKYRNAYIELVKSYADLRKNPPIYTWIVLFYGYLGCFLFMRYLGQ